MRNVYSTLAINFIFSQMIHLFFMGFSANKFASRLDTEGSKWRIGIELKNQKITI